MWTSLKIAQVESRFPAQVVDTLQLLTALAAPGIYDHFDALPSLTFANPTSTLFASRAQGPIANAPIAVSRNIMVPEGTTGQALSAPGADPQIVKWDMLEQPWSGWTLLGDILAEAAGVAPASNALVARDDVFSMAARPQTMWKSMSERDATVGAALDLIAAALECEDVQLFDDVLDVQILFRCVPALTRKITPH